MLWRKNADCHLLPGHNQADCHLRPANGDPSHQRRTRSPLRELRMLRRGLAGRGHAHRVRWQLLSLLIPSRHPNLSVCRSHFLQVMHAPFRLSLPACCKLPLPLKPQPERYKCQKVDQAMLGMLGLAAEKRRGHTLMMSTTSPSTCQTSCITGDALLSRGRRAK